MAYDGERIARAAADLLQAPSGKKGAVIDGLASDLGVSRATAYRLIDPMQFYRKPRKRRSDCGKTEWKLAELELISALLLESRRANGKRLSSIDEAIDMLRANGAICGEYVDTDTGEVRLLSVSSAAKALRTQRLHPDQLCAPAPKVQLSTERPNQLWQADPSLCVLYYLRRTEGLAVMPQSEFYKNKPKNLERIANDRVWRYVYTDHASGAFYVEYVLGAESGANLCQTFINAMQYRGAADPFCGAPDMIMVDPGSANTSAMFNNLCDALAVTVKVNKPGQPWAKGQVEKTNDIIERSFEHRLRYHRVESLEALNEAAWRWMRHHNATVQHSRHGSSRYQAWMTIKPEHLHFVPSVGECLRLATHKPEERKVNSLLRISFRGHSYDVSGVPGVIVGEKLTVTRNAFGADTSAQVRVIDDEGRTTWFKMEALQADAYGFKGAVALGSYASHADTQADTNRKRVERIAMDVETDAEAEAKRKAKAMPFGGRIDPYKSIHQAPEIPFLPRRGYDLNVEVPAVAAATPRVEPPAIRAEFAPLDHVSACMRLKPLVERAGVAWSPDMYARTAQRWPDGVPVDDVESWAVALATPDRGGLRIVGGAA